MIAPLEEGWGASRAPAEETPLTVLAVVDEEATRALLPRVLTSDRLVLASDLAEGIALAQAETPDVAFVDVGINDGAGLAMIHHLKALAPDTTVFALASKGELESGAHAVALGGAGLFLLPLGGDEVLNAVGSVRHQRAERALRLELERDAARHTRSSRWIAQLAELADARDRNAAAQQVADIFAEATGAEGAAVYLIVGQRTTELVLAASTPAITRAPAFGTEVDILDFARREQLAVVPLALRKVAAGHVLLMNAPPRTDERPAAGGPGPIDLRREGLVKLLGAQATTSLSLLWERERESGGAAMKDPASSAYSFAYYVDVAGREIDKAKRYGRRFTIATIVIEPPEECAAPVPADVDDLPPWSSDATSTLPAMSPLDVAEQLLHAVRDTDILARVDENEFHLLMPETDGLDAHACHRRMISRLAGSDKRAGYLPRGLLVGVATFPHDGQSLAQLLRIARRRADATKCSIVHRISPDQRSIGELLDVLLRDTPDAGGAPFAISALTPLDLSLAEAVALATSVVRNALRGGAVFVAVAHHAGLSLGAAVRAILGPPRDDLILHAIDLRASADSEDIEALCVIAEHGAYALLGRNRGGFLRGVHAADPLLADFLAERLGRAAGLRVFG